MKIVIAGGGTAGWLAALFISHHSNHDVTVVASSQVGIIGAGEAVTGELMDVVTGYYGDFGIDPYDFLMKTGAMPKYGILHKDWTPSKGSAYFGPIDGNLTGLDLPDEIMIYLSTLYPDKMHMGTIFGNMYEYNISPISKVTDEFEISNYAFHVDAKLASEYLEKVSLRYKNCNLIDAKILESTMTEGGLLKSIILDNGDEIEADFFVDATGFSRLLINKFNPKWISYKKNLPVNTALPFFVDYEKGETQKCYSLAWAQSSGWYWEAALQHRKGCGYVFSDEFISVDEAHVEIEKSLGRSITPIKVMKFDSGRLENSWIKNCLAVGLSSAFAEPLEATSIHATIKSLSAFTIEFLLPTLEDTINQSSIELWNKRMNRMYDDFKDFLSSHYLGGRTDTEFWKYMSSETSATDFAMQLKETCKSRIPTKLDFNGYPGAAGWLVWGHILFGTKQITSETTSKYLNSTVMSKSEEQLKKLVKFSKKYQLTNYNFSQYIEVLKTKNIKFVPRRGGETLLEEFLQ